MTLHRRNPRRDRNERLIVEYLRAAGCLVHAISGPGIPDLLVGYRGTWLLIEVKGPRGKLEPLQNMFHATAQALKLPCHLVRTVDDAQSVLRSHARRQ